MSKDSNKVHAIIYQRVLVGDNIYIFVPCNVEGGTLNSDDGIFMNESGFGYSSCSDYESVKDSRFQTYYYFAKTNQELMDEYNTSFIEEAAGYYFDDLRNGIVVGFMDDFHQTMSIQYLSTEVLKALNNPISYQLYQGHGTVTLTKEQMIKLLNSRDIKTVKKEIGQFIAHSKNIERFFKEKSVAGVDMTSDGGKIIGYRKPAVQSTSSKSVIAETGPEKINEVERYIKDRVVGQDEFVEDALSIVFWNLASTDSQAIIRPLLVGQTGSGKTFFFETLGECLDVPVVTIDCNAITQSGYEGKSVNDILVDAYLQCGKNMDLFRHMVIYLDEFDKIANRGAHVSDIGAQNSLLKLAEGGKFVLELDKTGMNKIVIDTSMMTICAGGAFQDVIDSKNKKPGFVIPNEEDKKITIITRKDIEQYGFIRELTGRFEHIINLNKVTREMIRLQLTTSKASQLLINQDAFMRLYGVNLRFSDGYIERACDLSIEDKTGFRGIKSIVVGSLSKAKYVIQKDEYQHYDLLVTEETIDNPKKYVLQ